MPIIFIEDSRQFADMREVKLVMSCPCARQIRMIMSFAEDILNSHLWLSVPGLRQTSKVLEAKETLEPSGGLLVRKILTSDTASWKNTM
jgi:hypothetical protein